MDLPNLTGLTEKRISWLFVTVCGQPPYAVPLLPQIVCGSSLFLNIPRFNNRNLISFRLANNPFESVKSLVRTKKYGYGKYFSVENFVKNGEFVTFEVQDNAVTLFIFS